MWFSKKKQAPEKAVEASPYEGVVKNDEQFHADTLKFVANLCGVLTNSYGPLGSNTMIENDGGVPIITKDGYTILDNLRFSRSQDQAVHQLIKKISYNLVKTVGDGSTSAVLSASFLYESLSSIRNGPYTRKQLLDILDRIVHYLEIEISDSLTHTIHSGNKRKVLSTIASISNNNDLKIGDYISKIFADLSYLSDIRIEDDPKDSTVPLSHVVRYGFTFERGPAHNMYFKAKSVVVVDKPIVFISYEFFPEHYEAIKKVQQSNPDRNIVVITEQTHEDTLNDCFSDHLKGKNKVYVIKSYDLANPGAHDELLDLAIYLDADIIRDVGEFKTEQLGQCRSMELNGTKTIFLSGQGMEQGTPFYHDRIAQLEKEYDEVPINLVGQRGTIRVRLSKLNGVSVRILVGGTTAEEKQMRRFLVEDAVLACKSALAKGYGFGGNISLYFATRSLSQKIEKIAKEDYLFGQFAPDFIAEIVRRMEVVYYATFYCIISKDAVLHRGNRFDQIKEQLESDRTQMYDALDRKFKTIDETSVLAPIDTDVQILKASVSIVGMLLSINQLIS